MIVKPARPYDLRSTFASNSLAVVSCAAPTDAPRTGLAAMLVGPSGYGSTMPRRMA
ncbi:hypothetical protein [Gaiella sp.]|uniref:hypothetical protein n=1 Tax=Gaiella sp. TaxID=2663207 RepID=UPI00326317D5